MINDTEQRVLSNYTDLGRISIIKIDGFTREDIGEVFDLVVVEAYGEINEGETYVLDIKTKTKYDFLQWGVLIPIDEWVSNEFDYIANIENMKSFKTVYEDLKYKKRNKMSLNSTEKYFLELINTIATIEAYIITYYKQEMEGDICIDRILEEIKKIEI